jgi:hypothetical protein
MADIDEEFAILDVRLGQFLNLWTVLIDYFSGTYVPSIEYKAIDDNDYRYPATFPWTMMSLLYSFFFSLVDTHSKSLNAFHVWRRKFPEQASALDAVEFRVQSILPELKNFRNKLGFHGSRSISDEEIGFELLERHGSIKVLNVAQHFIKFALSLLSLANSTDSASICRAKESIKIVEEICKPDSPYDFNSEELLVNWFRKTEDGDAFDRQSRRSRRRSSTSSE